MQKSNEKMTKKFKAYFDKKLKRRMHCNEIPMMSSEDT